MYRSSGLSRAFFSNEPPCYEHEVLASVEEIATSTSKEIDFSKVIRNLDKSAENIVSSISDESEKTRIQAQIEAERIQDGIAQTNYELMNVAYGIDHLDDTLRQSAKDIAAQIQSSSNKIASQISESNQKLSVVDNKLSATNDNLLMINNTMSHIGSALSVILKCINKPNETEAIELADQARIKLALGDYDDALEATKKAMTMCNTSITVMAYHLMTLSIFDDETSKQQLKKIYLKFVKLVGFKLSDTQSDTVIIRDEVYYLVYPTIFALSRALGNKAISETQSLYTNISKDHAISNKLLIKPLLDKPTLDMTLHPTLIRELNWTVILTEVIIKNGLSEHLASYITTLTKSNVLIKNELLNQANQELYKSGLLVTLLDKTWHEDKATDKELNCLDVFIAMQPQDNINLDDKTLLLLNRYVTKHEVPINQVFKNILASSNQRMQQGIKETYLDEWDKYTKNLEEKESKALSKLSNLVNLYTSEINDVKRKKIELVNSNNTKIEDAKNIMKLKINEKSNIGCFSEPYLDGEPYGYIAGCFVALSLALSILLGNGGEFWGTMGVLIVTGALGVVIFFVVRGLVKSISKSIYASRKSNYQSLSEEIGTLESEIKDLNTSSINAKKNVNVLIQKSHSQLIDGALQLAPVMAIQFIKKLHKQCQVISNKYYFEQNKFKHHSELNKTEFEKKFHNEMLELIPNQFPRQLKLSNAFCTDFKILLESIANIEPTVSNDEKRLLFGVPLKKPDTIEL